MNLHGCQELDLPTRSSGSARRHRCLALLTGLALSFAPTRPASAYEDTTHAGMTGEAALGSNLHRFLRQSGLELGLFEVLSLDPSAMTPRDHRRLTVQLERLDPAGGYRPGETGQWALGWIMAGAVLQQLGGSTDRHHFYDPTSGAGLNDSHPPVGSLLAVFATLEGPDTLRRLMTGSAFSLSGQSATQWIHSTINPHHVERALTLLREAVVEPTARRRRHALAGALMALGGLLHVLQDMAVPGHTRNDYLHAQLSRLGSSHFDRGSRFQRYVSLAYGRTGLPSYEGPAPKRARVDDYFANAQWTGLANLTHLRSFSPATLPGPQAISSATEESELVSRINRRLRYAEPRVPAIDLACARHGRRCYVRGKAGNPLAAYQLDRSGRLTFKLDRHCLASTARTMVPLAIGFSRGLVNHLLRGALAAEWDGSAMQVTNLGPALASYELRLLAEDSAGRRHPVAQASGAALARHEDLSLSLPGNISEPARLVVLLEGKDEAGDAVLAHASVEP